MKKRVKIIFICLIISFISFIFFYKKDYKYISSQKSDAVLAMTLDGNRIEQFPEKGKYSVEINCKNAFGKWNSEHWKLELSDISGKVVCNLDFSSNPSTIANVVENKILDSGDSVPKLKDDAVYEKISSVSEYGTITNSSTYPFTFDTVNKKWTMTATASSTSSFTFYPKENGYYQVCYELPASASTKSGASYSNYIRLYSLNSSTGYSTISSNINNGDMITGCKDYGYVTTNDYIYLSGKYYDANISFYFNKSNEYTFINTGYRYEGGNPNNYIWFNNEMWRIIGSIPTKIDANGDAQNLVKIIRKDLLGTYAYDASVNSNDAKWGNNTLYQLLNQYYFGKKNGTDTNYCFVQTDIARAKCDFRSNGIDPDTDYGKMIKKVYWNTGQLPGLTYISWDEEYEYEISSRTTQGYVGLLSASDFGYAMGAEYYVTVFASGTARNNWIYGVGEEWTITPSADTTLIYIESDGLSIKEYSSTGVNVRPVVYLDSSVYVVSGDGTETNPYQIGM